ncbi:MAG: carbamoyltransferase HypF [Curvibacter sp.]|nr:carbamoyltransferase HypF [Curvibacter sp.]
MTPDLDPGDATAPPRPRVLALGAWLKNSACLLGPEGARWSPAHGDLGDPAACRALEASARALLAGAAGPVQALAHDLHPDFFSTRLALSLADELGVPALGVQHHHAHIAAVMAEHGLESPTLGLALDGVGLGSDGSAWGGELLWVAPGAWRRLGGLWPLALPGGDVAAREPWRMAASVLQALGRGNEIGPRFSAAVGAPQAQSLQGLLQRGLHCPPSSSTGRWFDAAAGALGLSLRQSHEAEAAMALEQAARRWLAAQDHTARPAQPLPGLPSLERLDLRPLLAPLFDTAPGRIDEAAAGFHLGLADALAAWVLRAVQDTGCHTLCLGGGCFLNQVLSESLCHRLAGQGLRVLRPQTLSCGDAGLALGQAWVAARHDGNATASLQPLISENLPCA